MYWANSFIQCHKNVVIGGNHDIRSRSYEVMEDRFTRPERTADILQIFVPPPPYAS